MKHLLTFCLFLNFVNAFGQSAMFSTVPAAANGSVNVCAGSTILFNSTVNPAALFSPAIYSWNFGNGQTSSLPGPLGITYATPGTYTVTLNISSAGVPLTPTTITVNVSAAPATVPTFNTVGGNNCEQLFTVNGIPMIQTTGNNCNCNQYNGPMISLNNANALPAGSTATIFWGANGLGGTSTTFPVGMSNTLSQPFNFPGQQNNNVPPGPSSHYSTPGSYNLMYLVTYPNGCTYSTYVIMSYGPGNISLGPLSAQLLCNPLNYNLTFANQTPGNTYVINWGDGTPNTTYTYPNLPLLPNGVPHQYSSSACVNGVAQPYTITVTATNPCPGSTTTSTIGPFNVNALPLAAFTSVPGGNFICQNQSITFTNTSTGGLSINNGQCSNAYNFGWQIDYSSSLSGLGYQVTSGSMGDPISGVDGSNALTVQFTQPGTYTISLDAANNACGMDTYVYIITVNGVDAGPNQSVCAGTAVTLTGAGSQNCTWNNGVVNGVPFIPLTTQTYTLTGTNTNGCAGIWNGTDQVTVTVNPLPTVSAGNNQSVCAGSPVTLSGSGASTYSWNNGVQNGVPFTPNATQTYTVTGTDANGCSNTAQVTLTLNPIPTVSAGSNQTVCAGTQVTLSGSGAVNYSWNNGVINGTSFTPLTTQTYTVTGTNANGCSNTAQVTVTVNPSPNISGGNNQSICIGSPVTLSGSGATNYTWNNGVVNGTTFTPLATQTYTVTGTNANGCSNTAQVTVTVNPLPTVSAGSNQSVCVGTLVTLIGSGANTYSWTNGVANATPFIPMGTQIYTVTGTNANGCSNTAQVTVTVNPSPNVSAGSNQSVCAGSPVTLSGSGASSYTWSNGISNGVPFVPVATQTYTVTGTANGCSNTAQVTVTVNPSPNVSAGNNQSVCAGSPVTLSGSGASSYTWSNGISDGVAFVPVATQLYTVTGTANGCSNTAQVTVTVNPSPNVSAGADQSICVGEQVILSASGGNTYNWNNNVVNGQAFSPNQTADYMVTGIDLNGCTGMDTVSVAVLQNSVSTLTQTALDSYTLNGQTYTQSGTYTQTVPAANGCDSTITLNLTLNFTGIDELGTGAKKLVKITDLNGKIIPRRKNTLMLFIYEDGTVERVVEMEE